MAISLLDLIARRSNLGCRRFPVINIGEVPSCHVKTAVGESCTFRLLIGHSHASMAAFIFCYRVGFNSDSWFQGGELITHRRLLFKPFLYASLLARISPLLNET